MISNDEFVLVSDEVYRKTKIIIIESNINAVRRFVYKKINNNMSIVNYIDLIKKNDDEFNELLQIVTINETYFFREEKYFKLLDELIIPELKNRGIDPLFWSGAVSTGEEAISMALLYKKHFKNRPGTIAVIATDIDVLSMSNLKENKYNQSSLRNDGMIFHDLILKNSRIVNNIIKINKDVMDIIDFKKINLITDDFKTVLNKKPSVILLCNVLIYMGTDVRETIINKAVEELEDGGYLIVSSSNTAFIEHPLIELIQTDNSFYFKKIKRDANV